MSLCLDNIKDILSYLDRKDLYYLSLTSTFYNKLIQFDKIITKTIKSRLVNIFGEHYDVFVKMMIDNGAFISGSFIIQCILNEDWSLLNEKTDIDIYVPFEGDKRIEHTFDNGHKVFYNQIEDYIYNVMGYDYWEEDEPHKMYTRFKYDRELPTMTKIRTYTQNGINLQIISLDTDKYYDYNKFVNLFDFDICKNIYYPTQKLYINNIVNVLNKRTTFNATWNLRLSVKRYHKYTNYGFVITKDITYDALKDADNCDIKVYSENINKVSEHIKQIVNIKEKKTNKSRLEKCVEDECFLHFIDPTIKHSHIYAWQQTEDIIIT